jgi:CheY-like chemotaxis protein
VLYPLSYEGRDPPILGGRQRRSIGVVAATVLVVDDDPVIQRLLKVNFEMEGYNVVIASDGVEGLERARSERPDIIVLDVMMPKLSGLDVAKALKSDPETSSIPVLLLSAKAQEADLRAGDQTGADGYLTKPFDPLHLLQRVEDLIAGTS